MKKLLSNLIETINKEKALVRFVFALYFIGITAGTLFINFVTKDDKKLLISQVTVFFNSIKKLSSDVFGSSAFFSILLNNLTQLFIIFVLGISIIVILAVIVIIFFKGFTLGTTLSSILLKYKYKGTLAIILYVFPVTVINIFIYFFMSFFAIYVSLKFIRAFIKKDNLDFKKFLGKYVLSFIISIILIILCSLLDAYLTPFLLRLFTYLI